MDNGIDSVFVKNSGDNSNWISEVPEYYGFDLKAGEVLLFNNSHCIHQFINTTGEEVVYTIRLTCFDSSPLILCNDIFNWKQAYHFSKILVNGGLARSTIYIN